MPKYKVYLYASALIKQQVEIEANTAEEAEEKALLTSAERVWVYDGLDDDSPIEATVIEY